MDVRFINPFIRACHQLFDRHLGMQVSIGKPQLKGTKGAGAMPVGVSIAVDLSGSVRGRVKLHFTEQVALALAGSLAGTMRKKIDEETLDALREISNMIVGSAKREFPGELTKISTPQLISSQFDEWRHDRRVLIVPLRCMAGEFQIEVKIQDVAKATAKTKPAEQDNADPNVDQNQVDEMVARLLAAQA